MTVLRSIRHLGGLRLSLAIAAAFSASGLMAQQNATRTDTVEAAGARYRAGGLHRLLLGPEYRSLWTTPISVEVLNLHTFAGGLHPVSKGGGQQTKSLLLAAPDGREFCLMRSREASTEGQVH